MVEARLHTLELQSMPGSFRSKVQHDATVAAGNLGRSNTTTRCLPDKCPPRDVEAALEHSVAVVCAIIETETTRFHESGIAKLHRALAQYLETHRRMRRPDFARTLQAFAMQQVAQLIAEWWEVLGQPAQEFIRDRINEFLERVDSASQALQQQERPLVSNEVIQLDISECPVSSMVGAPQPFDLVITVAWFRKRMLRQAEVQLIAGLDRVLPLLARRLMHEIRRHSSTSRHSFQHRECPPIAQSATLITLDHEDPRCTPLRLPWSASSAVFTTGNMS
jgi:hypothetical protein